MDCHAKYIELSSSSRDSANWCEIRIRYGFYYWRLRETRVTNRQGRQTALSFLCDKII